MFYRFSTRCSFSVPIFEGYASPHMIQHLEIAGRHLDSFLNRILFEKEYKFTTPLELISEIKENLYIVRPETKFEPKEIDFKVHPLPDDSIVRLTTEKLILF